MRKVLNPTSYLSFLQVEKKHNLEEALYKHLDVLLKGDVVHGEMEKHITHYEDDKDHGILELGVDHQTEYFSEEITVRFYYYLTPLERDYYNYEGQRTYYTSGGGEAIITMIELFEYEEDEPFAEIHPTTHLHKLSEILTIIYHN